MFLPRHRSHVRHFTGCLGLALLWGCAESGSEAEPAGGGAVGGTGGQGAPSTGGAFVDATGGAGAMSGGATGSGAIGGGTGNTSGTAGSGGTGSGAAPDTGGASTGGSSSGSGGLGTVDGGIVQGPGGVAIDRTPGRWHTDIDPDTGRMAFFSPDNQKTVLRGVSMTGMETGTRGTQSGAGFWLFNSGGGNEAQNAPTVIENVVDVLATEWQSDVVRIPICGSAWTQDYLVRDWGDAEIAGYKEWVDIAVEQARAAGKVVIIDLHLWAIAKMSNGTEVDRGTFERDGATYAYEDWEDGCTGDNNVDGTDSCAPEDWYTADRTQWECAIANADGVTLHNAHKNRDHIREMWIDVANRYKHDSAIWFELFNEPYTRKSEAPYPAFGVNETEAEYPWDLWAEAMHLWLSGIRDEAGAANIVIINGLDWGYSFGPEHGPIASPETFLPWKNQYANIAYGFHPYQHGACCGSIGGGSTDESVSDPYQSAYCAYYPNGGTWGDPSGAALPGGASCIQNGYAETQDKKMPPCHWVAAAYNPETQSTGLCAGDRVACAGLSKEQCDQMDWGDPAAGGWSRYVLPMNAFGPLIATEFGSFDCSSPFVSTFLDYMRTFGISYTAWALWPQNSGGPGGLGACGYPSVMASAESGDFRACLDRSACGDLIVPLPWAGEAVFADLTSP